MFIRTDLWECKDNNDIYTSKSVVFDTDTIAFLEINPNVNGNYRVMLKNGMGDIFLTPKSFISVYESILGNRKTACA